MAQVVQQPRESGGRGRFLAGRFGFLRDQPLAAERVPHARAAGLVILGVLVDVPDVVDALARQNVLRRSAWPSSWHGPDCCICACRCGRRDAASDRGLRDRAGSSRRSRDRHRRRPDKPWPGARRRHRPRPPATRPILAISLLASAISSASGASRARRPRSRNIRARGSSCRAGTISGDQERKFCTRPTFTDGSWM